MREFDNNAHSVFLLYYHLILVVKYRKKVLNDPISDLGSRISDRARAIFEYIAPKYHITLEEWNHDEDHVHIMFRAIRSRNSVNLSMPIKVPAAV